MVKRQTVARTQQELATALGISWTALKSHKASGAPIGHKGPYDVESIRAWIGGNRPRSKVGDTPTPEPTEETGVSLTRRKLAAEVRIKEAQADQEECKRDKLRGALVTLAESKRVLASMATSIKQNVLAVPRASADRFVGLETIAEAEERLTVVLSEALEALSKADDSV